MSSVSEHVDALAARVGAALEPIELVERVELRSAGFRVEFQILIPAAVSWHTANERVEAALAELRESDPVPFTVALRASQWADPSFGRVVLAR